LILPRFDVLVPKTVAEACAMLSEHSHEGVRVLAGGTDLLVDLRRPIIPSEVPQCDGCPTHPGGGVLSTVACSSSGEISVNTPGDSVQATLEKPDQTEPAYLVSLHKLKELRRIESRQDGGLKVGALTTITDIERSHEIREGWPALFDGAVNLGSPLVRNRGTLGGNIVNARPAADMVIPTIALNGTLTLQGPSGSRKIAAADFSLGPGISVIRPDEILTEINFPPPPAHSGSSYYKLANRKVLEISVVGVAVWIELEGSGGIVKDVRVVLGAAGPTPILAESVKDILIGKTPDDETLRKASVAAADAARAIDDHRGSSWYRIRMIEQLTFRLLNRIIKEVS
jgi:carbon-monoxide dehydrogenase medium subunit